MTEGKSFQGWATLDDGTHVSLSEESAKLLWESVEANEARRAEMMPTTKEALAVMLDARERLRKLGWQPGRYCPKNGTDFAVIQHGSSGIFTGHYSGEWPNGYLHVEDETCHPDGVLWKPLEHLTEWEEEMRQDAARSTSQHIERLGRLCEA